MGPRLQDGTEVYQVQHAADDAALRKICTTSRSTASGTSPNAWTHCPQACLQLPGFAPSLPGRLPAKKAKASQSSHLGADGAGIEQPSGGIKPKMMDTYLDPTRMVSEDAENAELIRLLEGVVAKVECGMVELENRLKRALVGPGLDLAHVAPKISEQVAKEKSLGVTGGRGDLFRSVYGEARHRDRQNRRKHHSGNAQTGMTLLAVQEVAGRAGSHGELMARHTRSSRSTH